MHLISIYLSHAIFNTIFSDLSCSLFVVVFHSKQLEKIPMDDIKNELRAAQLSEQAVEKLLQILTVKSLEELEGSMSDIIM